MTAKTSRTDVESIVGALTLLFITTVDLIRKGRRDSQMIAELKKAMQFFRENKLGGVLARIEITNALEQSRETLCTIFSQKVEDVPFSEPVKRFLKQKKIIYVGEVFGIQYDFRKAKGKKRNASFALRDELLSLFGMVLDKTDPFAYGWEPPYWHEQWFLEELSQPAVRWEKIPGHQEPEPVSNLTDARRLRFRRNSIIIRRAKKGQHYVGHCVHLLLRTQGDAISSGRLGRTVTRGGITSSMYMLPEWVPPTEVPEEGVRFLQYLKDGNLVDVRTF